MTKHAFEIGLVLAFFAYIYFFPPVTVRFEITRDDEGRWKIVKR